MEDMMDYRIGDDDFDITGAPVNDVVNPNGSDEDVVDEGWYVTYHPTSPSEPGYNPEPLDDLREQIRRAVEDANRTAEMTDGSWSPRLRLVNATFAYVVEGTDREQLVVGEIHFADRTVTRRSI
jgi:hypothetical protein